MPSIRSRPLAPWAPWRERVPPVDDLAKLVAVASAVLYGILFLAYRSYYAAMEINPEDVGVTNSFVLARVLGFILITLLVGAVVVGYLFLASGFTAGPQTRADGLRYVTFFVLGAALYFYFSRVFPSAPQLSPLLIIVALGAIAIILNLMKGPRFAPYWPAAFAIVALLLSVAIPSIAVAQEAAQLGQRARKGHSVTPFNIFKIPIIDVSAPEIRLHWANPMIPHPREIFGHGQLPEPAEGVLLGQGDNVVIASVRVGGQYRVVRLNAGAVVVELL